MQIINIKDYGAIGNAKADDAYAIKKATSALKNNTTLYFPAGTYLIKAHGNLIEVQGLSDISIIFEPGAVLLMDNLDSNGKGSGHAFYFKGPAENLLLEGLHVKWKTKPLARSKGDAVMIDGPNSAAGPADDRTFKNITIRDCHFENTPQTGMVLMGCSDIDIENINLVDTQADGIHLNACRHYAIDNVAGRNLGDDNIALVTYYNPSEITYSLHNNNQGPYTQPDLGEWSNYQGTVSNVDSADDIGANGIRIAGAFNVNIDNVKAHGRKAGIIIDAGKKGGTYHWSYQASKQIHINNVLATHCHVGVHIMSYNVTPQNPVFWNFQINLNNVVVKDCIHDNILIEKCSGVEINNIDSYGNRIRMIHLNNLQVNNLRNKKGSVIVHGLNSLAKNLKLNPIPDSNLILDGILVYEGNIQIENANKLSCGYLYSYKSTSDAGCVMNNNKDVRIDSLVSRHAKSKGIHVINCQQLSIASTFIESSEKKFTSIEIGGGNLSSRSEYISIISGVYKNNEGKHDVVLQNGQYTPKNVSIHLAYSTRKKSDHWKHYLLNPYQAAYTAD